MENVLSVEQMQTLIEIGVDVSKASWEWYSIDGENWSISYFNDENTRWNFRNPTFDLQDILEILPKEIHTKKGKDNALRPHKFILVCTNSGYVGSYQRASWDCIVGTHIEKTPIEAAYQMLLWCIENKHIKTNKQI